MVGESSELRDCLPVVLQSRLQGDRRTVEKETMVGFLGLGDLSQRAGPRASLPSVKSRVCRPSVVVMGTRPLSPSASPDDLWGPQADGPGPAKRRRTEELEFLESDLADWMEPPIECPPTAQLVVPTGFALHLPLEHVDLLLELDSMSMVQVSLGDQVLMLIPEALLDSDVEAPRVQILEPAAVLSLPGEYMALEPEFCPAVQEVAFQEEANEDDADLHVNFPRPWMDVTGSPVSVLCDPELQGSFVEPWRQEINLSPEKGSSHHDDYLDLHLQEASHDSPLQPLPPSPSPGPVERPKRPQGPHCKARRSLILQ
ncbi:PREDICTED: proline-rich protein 23C-like [Bison bison bison]|uniref:Proline-rich protein 23C-like n=1 Tax=Bison bison bison TaxID=43346 RepID=A0A6P3IQL8_BISBB|nr:PREDICTED: proline-rich protein 23C-like [Bison bison bison]